MIEVQSFFKVFEEKVNNKIETFEENNKNLFDNQISSIKENILISQRKKKENEDIKSTIKTNSERLNEIDILKEIKDDINTHEENFEKVQENFIKMNSNLTQLEENIKIFNEIILTLKDNYDRLNKKFEEHVKSIDNWQKNIFNSMNNSMNILKDDYNKKISQNINNNNNNNINNNDMKSKIKLNENNQISNKTRNNDNDNINSDEKKIKTIEDFNKEKEDENENINLLTDNAYDFEDKDTDLREHIHGYINNIIQDFSLIHDNLSHEKITINNSDNNLFFKSKNNKIQNEKHEQNNEKSQKNEVFLRTMATELIEYKDNEIFYNYLKKYIHPLENIENEIEFNISESQNDKKNKENENIESDNDGYDVDNFDDIEELNI